MNSFLKEVEYISVAELELKIHIKMHFQSNPNFCVFVTIYLNFWELEFLDVVTKLLAWGLHNEKKEYLL